jgi:hypothetical protein
MSNIADRLASVLAPGHKTSNTAPAPAGELAWLILTRVNVGRTAGRCLRISANARIGAGFHTRCGVPTIRVARALQSLITCALRAHLIEPSGLSTRRSSDFRTNARALLMPSFAEGYGYPVAEPFVAM